MMTFLNDLKFALRSLQRTKGLAIAVVVTLALGIGANAAIFTLVRGVLLRPLVNRDESRLIFIKQSAPLSGIDNSNFSVPEIQDLKAGVKTLSEIGDFSTIGFTLVGLGEPREVMAGVVGGSYFEVMGLHPVLGRLLDAHDDGPAAAGAAVLTYRFWSESLKKDPSVIGKNIRLGSRSATIVGVLEPCVPYPADTEIIANVVTSPHHLSATMVTGRVHRMTQLFGRLAPGVTLEQANAELKTVYGAMVKAHPEAYSKKRGDNQIDATLLRDQINSKARTILLVLLASSILIFIIACSNVANLILARTVRREGELAIRAALGAGDGALRRTLLAESMLLCGTGAVLGVMSAQPLVAILARYASRFSPRAINLTVDSTVVWVGAILAILAAFLLAFVPRLPSAGSVHGSGLTSGSVRVTGGTRRRLQVFAVTQIAASFVLLVGASMLLKTLLSLESVRTGFDMPHVLAINVPMMADSKKPDQVVSYYKNAMQQISELPGVQGVAVGTKAPWRDDQFQFALAFSADGFQHAPGEEDPRAQMRAVSPGFFASLGVPLLEGRDFNDLDQPDGEQVAIVSESLAHRMFPGQDPLNRHVWWTDPVIKFINMKSTPLRIVGVVADIDDQNVIPVPVMTVYHPFAQKTEWGSRFFVHVAGNPYPLVQPVTKILRGLSADQVVEKAATLEDIRAEVLTPNKLNAVASGVFAGVALLIAVVGVAGVLAFSVSGRIREFGIRLAIGSQPAGLLATVLREGAWMAALGIAVGAAGGYAAATLAQTYFADLKFPSALPIAGSALILLAAAVIASALPAARAARVDVMQALRTE